jgi:hypothetical protein
MTYRLERAMYIYKIGSDHEILRPSKNYRAEINRKGIYIDTLWQWAGYGGTSLEETKRVKKEMEKKHPNYNYRIVVRVNV